MSKSAAFGLLLAGGIITLLVSVVIGLIGAVFSFIPFVGALIGAVVGVYTVWGVIVGLIMIWGANKINKGGADAHTWSIITLVLSILGLITGLGVLVGP